MSGTEKVCRECGQSKALSEYYLDKRRGADGTAYWTSRGTCKPCYAMQRRRRLEASPEQRQRVLDRYHRMREADPARFEYYWGRTGKLRQMGVTPEWVDELRRSVGGRCMVCRRGCVLVDDHEHETGRYRGLLCGTCNTGLGLFGDSVSRMQRAITYLQNPAGPPMPRKRRRVYRKFPPAAGR
jgi:hypothetical protein